MRTTLLPAFLLVALAVPMGSPPSVFAQTDSPVPPATTASAPPPAPPPSAPSPSPEPSAPPPSTTPPTTGVGPERTPRPTTSVGVEGALSLRNREIFSEDWWTHVRPIFEIHGLYRLRAELFHNFFLSRTDRNSGLWAPPIDYRYVATDGTQVPLSGLDNCGDSTAQSCRNKSQSSANMRFRLNPELHLSDSLRIVSQVDLLDNLVLGSTPNSYYNAYDPATGKVGVGGQSPYAPRSFFSTTAEPPTAGRNSLTNSLAVKRVWGEYMTPLGVLLRFGRQPNHWGLGMLHNSGDGFDSDWQSTLDRILVATSIKSLDLHIAAMWDFPHEGAIGSRVYEMQGQPYDLGQLDDVSQYGLMILRRRNPDLVQQDLAVGKAVLQGGIYTLYRNQILANDIAGDSTTEASLGQSPASVQNGLVRRNAWAIIPDAWAQVRYRKFRFEIEAATVQGSIENTLDRGSDFQGSAGAPDGWKIRQYMLATQTEFRAIEDRLRVQFGFGWSSGDPGILGTDALSPKRPGLPSQGPIDRTFSMGSFHPDYRVDLILFRNILSRVQGAYYFKPQIDYDFSRGLNGQKFGGGAAVIWSRASEFIQTPGHKRDLGVELDFQLYYQSKDGALNDDPERMGGFFTMLQYGVLFPLGGLGYQPGEISSAQNSAIPTNPDTSAAHTVRWYMGILF
ncbi:MAG: TIGR04551 family protein [Myxococcales bacterium]|nr:TIGR04551 family protein [Polyangiaceae bacterium]MDW8249460.1 TIGR04551 family protein [Myxococcales bacterium]